MSIVEAKPVPGTSRGPILLKSSIMIAFVATLIMIIVFVPIPRILNQSTTWIQDHGVVGYFCFIVAFWVTIVFGLPSTVFEAYAGFVFGFWVSIPITTIGKTGGCILAFKFGRFIGKDTIGKILFRKFPTFQAISKVFQDSSWRFLCLFQAAYVPIFVKCFGLSILEVSHYDFAMTTFVCGIPYTVFWSYLGSQSHNLVALLSGKGKKKISTEKLTFMGVGVLLGLVALGLLGRYANAQLKQMQQENEHRNEGDKKGVPDIKTSSVKAKTLVVPMDITPSLDSSRTESSTSSTLDDPSSN